MADVENKPDSSFPAQKLNPSSSSADSESRDVEVHASGVENLISSTGEKIGTESSSSLGEASGSVSEKDENVVPGDLGAEEKREGGVGEEEEEEEEIDRKDDPLAEVDLDNILPSRTRRRSIQPGVYISNDLGGGNNEDDDNDDSSDDSDA
ncbi:hypothetical protein Bca4012_061526 [Brassica carinata]